MGRDLPAGTRIVLLSVVAWIAASFIHYELKYTSTGVVWRGLLGLAGLILLVIAIFLPVVGLIPGRTAVRFSCIDLGIWVLGLVLVFALEELMRLDDPVAYLGALAGVMSAALLALVIEAGLAPPRPAAEVVGQPITTPGTPATGQPSD